MCDLIGTSIAPPYVRYGVLPSLSSEAQDASRVYLGHIPSGRIVMDEKREDSVEGSKGVGIFFAKLQTKSCATDECIEYEWVYPATFRCSIAKGVADGDVLWYCKRSEFQKATNASDYFWRIFTESSWTWRETPTSDRRYAWLRLTVNPGGMGNDYIGLEYKGTSYPNEGTTSDAMHVSDITDSPRLYTHVCGTN